MFVACALTQPEKAVLRRDAFTRGNRPRRPPRALDRKQFMELVERGAVLQVLLNLTLFVSALYQRMLGRREVQLNNVLKFLGKPWIIELDRYSTPRLQSLRFCWRIFEPTNG
jgi:hypothetical protein